MNAHLRTRLAEAKDAESVKTIELLIKSRTEPDFIQRLFDAVEQGDRSVIIGLVDDVPAGYAVVNWRPVYTLFARLGIPELQDLNVLPEHRCLGLGREIVLTCEDLARQRDYAHMGLAVGLDKSYGPAQRLYTRLGYMPDGYGVTYDREPVAKGQVVRVDDDLCLMMVKELLS